LKKQAIKAFGFLSLLFSLSAIHVYAQNTALVRKVEIPFDFSVGDKTFPAGTYSVARVFQDKSALLLTSKDGREAINILTSPVQARQISEKGRLLFRRYGETYFLFQIWEPDNTQGRQLSKSRTERSIERDLAMRGEASSIVSLVLSQ
jgi:hypothetical protein